MSRLSAETLENRWYDLFSSWDKADREAAMRALAVLHRHLPDKPKAVKPEATGGTGGAQLNIGEVRS